MLPSRQSPAFSEEGAHVVDPAERSGCAEVHVPERAHEIDWRRGHHIGIGNSQVGVSRRDPVIHIVDRDGEIEVLRALTRLWLVNRRVWKSGWWFGPTGSVAHDEADIDEYVARFGELLDELTRPTK